MEPRTRRGSNGGGDDAAGVDALEVDVPPRDSVLGADDGGGFADQRCDLRGELREAVRLDAEENHVCGAGIFQVADDAWMDFEVAVGAQDAQAFGRIGYGPLLKG